LLNENPVPLIQQSTFNNQQFFEPQGVCQGDPSLRLKNRYAQDDPGRYLDGVFHGQWR